MAKTESIFVLMLLALIVLSWVPISHSAKKPVSVARREDIPYVKCQVCEKLATQLYQKFKKKEAQISPKKVSEFQIIEIAENICNLKKEEADWILRIDIVENGDRLELVEQDAEGQCNSECKTIERACQEVMGYSDTDVAEYLFKAKPQLESLVKFLCKDLTKACSSSPPPLPKDRTPGEPFIPKSSKEAEMEKIMRSMQGMPGAPGMKMYSKEDLLNMQNIGGEDGDDDDDDDDDEGGFPSNLGQVLRDKETTKGDWKQRITEGITQAGSALKGHANKVSRGIKQWWTGKKTSSSKQSKGSSSEL